MGFAVNAGKVHGRDPLEDRDENGAHEHLVLQELGEDLSLHGLGDLGAVHLQGHSLIHELNYLFSSAKKSRPKPST